MAVIFLIDLSDHLPVSAHVFTNLPAHLNSALNPIFYGIFNSKMREGYKTFINLLTCSKVFKLDDSDCKKQLAGAGVNTHSDQTTKQNNNYSLIASLNTKFLSKKH